MHSVKEIKRLAFYAEVFIVFIDIIKTPFNIIFIEQHV